MSQVSVVIAGKTYRIACGDGEEEHLSGLADSFDARIEDMRVSFGEIGEMRLHVMAAITMADELHENRKRIAAETGRPRPDSDELARIKLEKLRLKQEMERLRGTMLN